MCQQMGGRGCDVMPCSAPEFWTAAFEGPRNCAFKLWDRKQIKHVIMLIMLIWHIPVPCWDPLEILVFYVILYELLVGPLHKN